MNSKADDFTLSVIDNVPKSMLDESQKGMLIIQNQNQKLSQGLNSRNENVQLHPSFDDQDGMTGQVSASFPHSGTQGTDTNN